MRRELDSIIAFIIIFLFFPTIVVLSTLAGAPSTGLAQVWTNMQNHTLEIVIGLIIAILYGFLKS